MQICPATSIFIAFVARISWSSGVQPMIVRLAGISRSFESFLHKHETTSIETSEFLGKH